MRKNVLKTKLKTLRNFFDFDRITKINVDKEYIQRYYLKNKVLYSYFHTKSGHVHMGISRNSIYSEKDLFAQPEFIQKNITLSTKRVLELATGRGANSLYLAKNNPKIKFYGLDLSEGQLEFAKNSASNCNNYFPKLGDYHNLSGFKENSFDLVFVVEALCHSEDKGRVFEEVSRVLKNGGKMIIFDGYYNAPKNREDILVQSLVAKGMALNSFDSYDNVIEHSKKVGFKVSYEEDLSSFVIPTMSRFEKFAKIIFRLFLINRLILWVTPREIKYNLLSAYLMPQMMREGLASYKLTTLTK